MISLPGLVDCHVHLREPGATYKEDFASGTAAALAGGITTVLAMPNTTPPIVDRKAFELTLKAARKKAHCDYGIYLGAAENNARAVSGVAQLSAGLKMYLDATFGPLLLRNLSDWMEHFQYWPKNKPIAAHAEQKTLAAFLSLGAVYQRPIHVCHVSRKEEILLIRRAKERGFQVTCEVTPHHLFLSEADIKSIGKGRAEVRPVLGTREDQQALWNNLDVIDCIATDHAPHTLSEKEGSSPPPGFPGLETALPLLLTAVQQGRLSLEDIQRKMVQNPRQIFCLPESPETWVEIDPDARYTITGTEQFTRCRWTPFEGYPVQGRIRRVVLRGETVFQDGEILAKPGSGKCSQAEKSPIL